LLVSWDGSLRISELIPWAVFGSREDSSLLAASLGLTEDTASWDIIVAVDFE